MDFALTKEQQEWRKGFRAFAEEALRPHANDFDKAEAIPKEVIQKVADQGYLGASISKDFGGMGLDQVTYGILTEEIGAGCSSVRSLLTVHTSIVAETIQRWGTKDQRSHWLPLLASGEKIGAFALSEPDIGSDAKHIKTTYEATEQGYKISGTKKWITFAQIADVFVVLAGNPDTDISAFLVERHTPGLEIKPMSGLLGTRASMLAELYMTNCEVPAENLLGRKGLGFLQIANAGLSNGRFSVAFGSLGIARASLEDSLKYANTREQFGKPLNGHQLIKQKLANMITDVKAARLLCYNAAFLRDTNNPNAFIQTSLAKYFASQAAMRCATEAVQLHGGMGTHDSQNVQRYFRDAKVMEIIEGSSEIQQVMLANYGNQSLSSILDS